MVHLLKQDCVQEKEEIQFLEEIKSISEEEMEALPAN